MARGTLSVRDELLALQHFLYQQIQTDITDFIGPQGASFKQYYDCYLKELASFDKTATKEELIRECINANVIFCGDYHTLRQSQRTALRILRELVKQNKPIILALEMVSFKHQNILDAYLKGQITDTDFLNKIQYEETWNFDWPNYKMLFDFSKKYNLSVVGLNDHSKKGFALRQRDKIAGKILSALYDDNPEAFIFVLYGDLHVCSNHLPSNFKKSLKQLNKKRKPKTLIVHQNSETLYWQLTLENLEQQTDVLRISNGIYCVMNTPPWVKLQTYLNWLERRQIHVDDDESLTEYEESHDFFESLWDVATTILNFFDISPKGMDTFQVYTKGDVHFLDYLNSYLKEQEHLNKFQADFTRAELIYNGTCYLPDQDILYFNSLNINRSAEKITELLHYKKTGSYLTPEEKADNTNFYFGRILLEALSFFGSKIINYKRKCETIEDIEETLRQLHKKRVTGRLKSLRLVAKLALDHFEKEQKVIESGKIGIRFRSLAKQPPDVLFSLTQTLGHLLGERLYQATLFGGYPKNHLSRVFQTPISSKTENAISYFALLHQLKQFTGAPKRKSDRF